MLLTFAEMELDSTAMFPPGTNVMFIRSTAESVLAQVVGHSEHGDAYRRIICERDGKTVLHDRTRDIPEGRWVPKDLLAPAKPPTKRAKPPPNSAAQSILMESGEHVQEFKVKWSRTKKFYTEPVKE